MSKIFVTGLAWQTDDETFKQAFEKYGTVEEAIIARDRETNRSRGFGYVRMSSDAEGEAAIEGMNNKELDGRVVKVTVATGRS